MLAAQTGHIWDTFVDKDALLDYCKYDVKSFCNS
jgi:hypothetical protein